MSHSFAANPRAVEVIEHTWIPMPDGTRLAAKMGALRKLITEANNGSGDEFNPFNESLKLACFQRYI